MLLFLPPLSQNSFDFFEFRQRYMAKQSGSVLLADWVGDCDKGIKDSPDHFSSTFVDLHVHHTSRGDVRGQVDLREFGLEKNKTNKQRNTNIRWRSLFVFFYWLNKNNNIKCYD